MTEKIDAIILAGTNNTLSVYQNGELVPKPYLELRGEPLVHYVCRVLAQVPALNRLIVVGEKARLEKVFSKAGSELQSRLFLLEQGRSVLENIWRAVITVLLPSRGFVFAEPENYQFTHFPRELFNNENLRHLSLLVVTSDLPFLTPLDVESFLSEIGPEVALAIGVVDYREVKRLASIFENRISLDNWKLGAIVIGEGPVRLGNMFFARPFMADARLYPLLDEVYENRRMLSPEGRVNVKNWYYIARSMLRYSCQVNNWWRFIRATINLLPAITAGALARAAFTKANWFSRLMRIFLKKKDLEFIGLLLVGVRGQLVINRRVGSALDIDVEEVFRFLQDESNFRRIASELSAAEDWSFCGEGQYYGRVGGAAY